MKPASEGSNDNIPEAVAEVTDFGFEHVQMRVEDQIVLLRKTDCFLNATQIITLAGKDKNERRILLDKVKEHTKVDVKKAREGSWANLQHVRILCKHLGLERQLQPLLEYAQRLQGDDDETAIPIDQDYLSEAGRVCFNGQVPRETPTSEGIDVEVQPSDIAGRIGASFRPDSALPQEWREGQQTEPMPPPDNSDPEDDQIQRKYPGGEYPISDTSVSESSISLSEASKERESEHSSVRLGATTAPLHQHMQYSLRETNPPSPPAMISYYRSRDYQPQYSRLSLLKPDLKPPSGIASPYKSFTSIC